MTFTVPTRRPSGRKVWAWLCTHESGRARAMAMSEAYQQAYEVGLSRGWSHAAYAEANLEPVLDAEKDSEAVGVPGGLDADGFRTGYRDGIDRHDNGQYPDGTPIEED